MDVTTKRLQQDGTPTQPTPPSKKRKQGLGTGGNNSPKKKRIRTKCSAEGCTSFAQPGGVCFSHGARRKPCSHEGCTKNAQKGGVCGRHGAKQTRKICSHEGCTNVALKGGVCNRHGAKRKTCSHRRCTNNALKGGVCVRHGAKKKTCSHKGCTNIVQKGGVCIRHGAKKKTCSHKGCTNIAKKGGVCVRHGAKKKTCSREGCASNAYKGGVCMRHGGTVKRCSIEGCTSYVQKGGLCYRHRDKSNCDRSNAVSDSSKELTAPTTDTSASNSDRLAPTPAPVPSLLCKSNNVDGSDTACNGTINTPDSDEDILNKQYGQHQGKKTKKRASRTQKTSHKGREKRTEGNPEISRDNALVNDTEDDARTKRLNARARKKQENIKPYVSFRVWSSQAAQGKPTITENVEVEDLLKTTVDESQDFEWGATDSGPIFDEEDVLKSVPVDDKEEATPHPMANAAPAPTHQASAIQDLQPAINDKKDPIPEYLQILRSPVLTENGRSFVVLPKANEAEDINGDEGDKVVDTTVHDGMDSGDISCTNDDLIQVANESNQQPRTFQKMGGMEVHTATKQQERIDSANAATTLVHLHKEREQSSKYDMDKNDMQLKEASNALLSLRKNPMEKSAKCSQDCLYSGESISWDEVEPKTDIGEAEAAERNISLKSIHGIPLDLVSEYLNIEDVKALRLALPELSDAKMMRNAKVTFPSMTKQTFQSLNTSHSTN